MRGGTETMIVDLKYDYQQLDEFGGHTVTFDPEGATASTLSTCPKVTLPTHHQTRPS